MVHRGMVYAVVLTAAHPDMFSAFVDIAGDLGPNTGSKAETITRLFGGNADACAAFDPTTIITLHGSYTGVSAWFDIAATPQNQQPSAAGVTRPPIPRARTKQPTHCARSARHTASAAQS
jgi:S-formylglutathione hydrolase FrmB